MKNHPAIASALENDHAVRAVPQVVVDWNMNRYYAAVADNIPAEVENGYDVEIFPIESIIAPNRPTKGINKARVGSALIGDAYNAESNNKGRYYIADPEDTYKYWTSPGPSDSTGAIVDTKPQVIYGRDATVNKIVITTENSWATAKTFSIQVTTSPTPADSTTTGNWTEIASNTSLGNAWKASGQIVLHWNGTAWVNTGRVDNADGTPRTTTIRGIRIVVTALEGGYEKTADGSLKQTTYKGYPAGSNVLSTYNTNGHDSFFDLIEISARLEVDLSKYVIDVNEDSDISDVSNLYPLGTVTTNQATISLSNLYKNASNEWVPGLFSKDNADSPYRDFIESNAEMTASLKFYDAETDALLDTVQQFKMYTDSWGGQGDNTVSVQLSDFSKFFDTADVKLRAAMWEELTVPEIIWRILDSVGFVDYEIDRGDLVTEHVIPVFYTDGTQTVWEVLDELAKASQTAIYFDSYGKLQVKTRDFAFSPDAAPVWQFTSETSAQRLANIVSLDLNTEFEPNYYKVVYQKTNWSKENRGQPTMQQVWQPETDAVVLRAGTLMRTLETNSTYFWLPASDARFWPYEGLVNIQGELIRFKGKHYRYYTGADGKTPNTMIVDSHDEYRTRNAKTPVEFRHKNHFTGAFKITERGVWNSENKRHPVEAEGYSVHQTVNGTYSAGVGGFRHVKQYSRVNLETGPRFRSGDIRLATRGQTDDLAFFNYGTRFRFIKQGGRTTQRAGIVIHNQANTEDGYYFEFTPSRRLGGKERAGRQEFILYARNGGKDTRLDTAACAIAENIDYELDIAYSSTGTHHRLRAWLNGKLISDVSVGGTTRVAANGKFGMFARGQTRVEYEYLYAIRREEEDDMPEDFSFLDKVERGYTGNQMDREWVYRWKKYRRRVKKKSVKEQKRFNRMFMDEFGPIVHEIREYEVAFDPAPVLHSRLYMTNDWSGCILEYRSDPFGAQFVIANTSRRNAVLHGEDSLSFSGTGESINQVLTVLGRALVVEESEEVIAKNETQIRRRGKAESEISSTWIQSKQMAQDLADWMNDNFSYGNESVTVEVFGNPLIEIGDVVHVTYPDKHVNADFFVVALSQEFSNGLFTTLTLRRRRGV